MYPQTITLDVAFEGAADTLDESLVNLAPSGIFYQIDSLAGPAGGWPEVTFLVENDTQASELASWFVGFDTGPFVWPEGESFQDTFLGVIGA